jgi:3'-phosphoadenosine 5'-phosphosulfate sulfotransferase (PAPS reductase)/FAD synthetase
MKKIVVPVSGGKDSQSCLKLACEAVGSEYVLGLFCDTQFEHPLTYQHIEKLGEMYEVDIVSVTGGSVPEKVLSHKRFPDFGTRFCTSLLKLRETKFFLRDFAKVNGPVEVWYGMRSGESSQRSKRYKDKLDDTLYAPHEVMPSFYPKYLAKLGVMFKMPILNWTEQEVFEYLNGEENPLYKQGFDRVGCFPCLAAGDKAKEKAFQHDDFGREQYKKVLWLSEQIGKSVWTSKGGMMRNNEDQGCLICSI